jgi:hypothetical protein
VSRFALAKAEIEKLRMAAASAEEVAERAKTAAATAESAAREASQTATHEMAALDAKVSKLESNLRTAFPSHKPASSGYRRSIAA